MKDSRIKAFVFDLDGTLYTGEREIPGATDALRTLCARGYTVGYFTNNSSRTAAQYVRRLTEFGFPVDPGLVISSGEVAVGYVADKFPGRRLFVFGTPAFRTLFPEELLDETDPEVVVMGYHTSFCYADLIPLCGALRRDLPFVATHGDPNCPREPFPVPDLGSMLALVGTSTGRRPDAVVGKPSVIAGKFLAEKLGLAPAEIAFVGDRSSTDMRLAENAGFFAVHVLSGVREPGPDRADLILPSVRDLPAAL